MRAADADLAMVASGGHQTLRGSGISAAMEALSASAERPRTVDAVKVQDSQLLLANDRAVRSECREELVAVIQVPDEPDAELPDGEAKDGDANGKPAFAAPSSAKAPLPSTGSDNARGIEAAAGS
mmetsp:Transcript_98162/g.282351  ORF Transcript_98162/g.282351 Transcript_98162/m.282351 type:complete len:125 (-) Transcript_98162:239-613(-)